MFFCHPDYLIHMWCAVRICCRRARTGRSRSDGTRDVVRPPPRQYPSPAGPVARRCSASGKSETRRGRARGSLSLGARHSLSVFADRGVARPSGRRGDEQGDEARGFNH